jgi:hypothetical protein
VLRDGPACCDPTARFKFSTAPHPQAKNTARKIATKTAVRLVCHGPKSIIFNAAHPITKQLRHTELRASPPQIWNDLVIALDVA